MKLKTTLGASLFAVMAALAFNVNAAADTLTGAKSAPDAATDAKAEKTAHPIKMRPHSHAEEKTGVAQRTPTTKQDKPDAAKDMSKHFHPRDGK